MATRFTTFRYRFDRRVHEDAMLHQHAGASRFAFNQGLHFVKEALEQRKSDESIKVPWSDFDLINAFNKWKHTSAAGLDDNQKPGLPWKDTVCAQVFEEALVDAAKGLKAFVDSRRGKRKGKKIAFPKFKKKHKCRLSFRFRNKIQKGMSSIRVERRGVRLPKIGLLKVHDDTRKLRRILRRGGRIVFATVSFDQGAWYVAVNVEAKPLHPSQIHQKRTEKIGLDRGLTDFIVGANQHAEEIHRVKAPKPLKHSLRKLRIQNRSLSRKKKFSKNWVVAKKTLNQTHARIKNIRNDFLHKLSTRLIKNHDSLVIEHLNIAGLIKNPKMSRHIADAAWGEFARMLEYKAAWHGTELEKADRFFASTQTCSQCHRIREEKLTLKDRVFKCPHCGFTADRDVNAGASLAQQLEIGIAAAKRSEALKACGEESSGSMKMSSFGRPEA